jgi:hypothetical protein
MNTPITDAQIHHYFPNINVIQYKDLKNYHSIADLCNNDHNACFILYVNDSFNNGGVKTVSGHWNALIYDPAHNSVNLFDSYGDCFNDRNLILIGKNRKLFGENEPLLSNMLLSDKSIDTIHYNNKPYQLKNGSQTCGRHCIYRLQNKDMNNTQYHRHLTSLKKNRGLSNFDQLIVELIK